MKHRHQWRIDVPCLPRLVEYCRCGLVRVWRKGRYVWSRGRYRYSRIKGTGAMAYERGAQA